MLKILISLRVVENATYKERRDAISHEMIRYLESHDICPILVSNALISPASFLNSIGDIDGILLTGGNSVGVEDMVDPAKERDELEHVLIQHAEENKYPLVGICRGLHVLNKYYGGSIVPNLIQRGKDNHVNQVHSVNLIRNQLELPQKWKRKFNVNSYHEHGVTDTTLAPSLIPFAESEDGVIEALKHQTLPIWAVQWHPERGNSEEEINNWIIDRFRQR
jgi:putative glutamine amidotransferase